MILSLLVVSTRTTSKGLQLMSHCVRLAAGLAMALTVLTTGCAAPGAKCKGSLQKPPQSTGKSAVRQTAVVIRNRDGSFTYQPLKTPLPVPLDKPLTGKHGMKFKVTNYYTLGTGGEEVTAPYEYTVLVIPDVVGTAASEFHFTSDTVTGGAGVHFAAGWGIFTGRFPISRTPWVHTSATGTQKAVRLINNANPQLAVYNLEPQPAPGQKAPCVVLQPDLQSTPSWKVPLTRGQRSIVDNKQNPGKPPAVNIPAGDPFVKAVNEWAAGGQMTWTPF
jgi:hypothetical protein